MNNGDKPASPVKPEVIQGNDQVHLGLTKREQFAAMAMQGILANSGDEYVDVGFDLIASHSAEVADALLKELDTRYV